MSVSFLKKLLGTTDAMADARAAVDKSEGSPPHGWNVTSPEVEQTDSEVIQRMDAPGLDPSSLESSVDGDALVLKARGTTDTGSKVSLNERLKLAGAGDLSAATVSYEDGKLVVRIPKPAFPSQSST
jgi:HSP20 family molecular chaperone IbpA